MSISPINFNGMIQNTEGVKNAHQADNSKPEVQQAAVTLEISKKEEQQAKQVLDPNETAQNYDREGDGKGYKKSSTKMLKKKSDKKGSDGKVTIKPMSTFDIKI